MGLGLWRRGVSEGRDLLRRWIMSWGSEYLGMALLWLCSELNLPFDAFW